MPSAIAIRVLTPADAAAFPLVRARIAEASTIAGLEQLDLAVAVTQPAAHRLYQSLGFSTYGCEPRALKIGANPQSLIPYRAVICAPSHTRTRRTTSHC